MKKFSSLFLCAVAAMAAVSCSKEIQNEQPTPEVELFPMTITATSTDTKTELVDQVSIKWLTTDKLSVFDGTGNREFTSKGEGKTVEFDGEVAEAATYYALYPYNAEASISGTTVNTTLSANQPAKAGSFADGFNINAAAAAATEDFHFTNVLSVAKLSVAATNLDDHSIASITLTSTYNLAGDVVVSYGDNITAAAGTNAVKEVTLTSESGLVDGDYYFCLLPNAGGEITLTFTDTDGKTATKTATLTKPFTAGTVKNLGTVKGLTWEGQGTEKSFVKIESIEDITDDGQYVIGAWFNDGEDNAFYAIPANPTVNSGKITGEAVTVSSDKISASDAEGFVWTISQAGSFYELFDGSKYLYHSNGGNSGTNLAYGNSTSYPWSISVYENTSNGVFKFAGVNDGSVKTRGLLFNGEVFGGYALSNAGASYPGMDIYKLEDDRETLATPTGLAVEDMTLSWNAVEGAASYVVTVGETEATVETTSYTFAGEADYYNVSVVAVPADEEAYKASAPATISNARFGVPTLKTPVLSEGVVEETSITVTWTIDPHAETYTCEIYDGDDKVAEDLVEEGTVTFENLENNKTYTVKVYADAVTSPLAYLQSEVASINVSTKAKTTISTVIEKGADNYVVADVTVFAVKGNALILGDETGKVYAYKSSHGLSVGDVVTVTGATKLYNGVYEFDGPTFTEKGTTTVNHGTAAEIASVASTLQSEFLSAENRHSAVYVHGIGTQDGRTITVGNTALYLSANESATDGEKVEVYGYVYAYSEDHSNFNFLVTSIEKYINPADPTMEVSPAELSWSAAEFGSENAKTFTVTLNQAASGYTVTGATSDWTVSDDGNGTVTVYPNSANTSTTDVKALTLTVKHNDKATLTEPVTLTQKKANSETEHVATINFGSATGSTNVNSASVSGTDSEGNTWTITTVGTTSFTPNSAYAQIGSSNKPATSITFTTTLPNDASDISLRAKFGGFSGTAGTVTMKVGDSSIGTGALNSTTDVTVESTSSGDGKVLTVTVTGISKGVKAYWIEATYTN